MPLVHSKNITDGCHLMIWKLTESLEELEAALPSFVNKEELLTTSHPQKKREWMGGRILLNKLVAYTGQTFQGLRKDEHGKPFLKNSSQYISLTHTIDYVAAVIHPTRQVGIDMEKEHEKLLRTARKYMTDNEINQAKEDITTYCIYWCAKEAMYKLNGRKKVSFKDDISIRDIHAAATEGVGLLHDEGNFIKASIHIRWVEDYCLVVAV
jgi:phosphopantetheinyl transferase